MTLWSSGQSVPSGAWFDEQVEKRAPPRATPFDFWKKCITVFPANSVWLRGLQPRLSMTGPKAMVLQTPAPPAPGGWSIETGVMAMKTLMLAAVTALSLGAGAAMAQVEGGNTYPIAPITQPAGVGLIQSGSSDVTPAIQGPLNWQKVPALAGEG
jgi:hypothetical protein